MEIMNKSKKKTISLSNVLKFICREPLQNTEIARRKQKKKIWEKNKEIFFM